MTRCSALGAPAYHLVHGLQPGHHGFATEVAVSDSHRTALDPSGEPRLAAERAERAKHLEEGILNQVLEVLAVA